VEPTEERDDRGGVEDHPGASRDHPERTLVRVVSALVEDRDREASESDGWSGAEQTGEPLRTEPLGQQREGDYE
jgi:hypothetical protein